MIRASVLFILLAQAVFVRAQTAHSADEIRSLTDKELAAHHICALQGGALLVRIHGISKVSQALRRDGKELKANEFAEARNRLNRKIQEAFEKHWDFCPVYFFEAESSPDVRAGRLQNVFFLGEKLERDAHIDYPSGIFYTAEFGTTPTKSPEKTEVMYINENGKTEKATRENPAKAAGGYHALHIMNHRFEGLSRPFPYSVRTFDHFIFRRSPAAAVRILNKRLHDAGRTCK